MHPADISPNQYNVSKSGSIQKSRNAFAAAEYSLRSHLVKRSKETQDKDFLKKMTSQIKEKEDASIQSACELWMLLRFLYSAEGEREGLERYEYNRPFTTEATQRSALANTCGC